MPAINYHLVIQSFGRENEYRRAVFTILSFYAHSSRQDAAVILFTDRPDWFEPYLKGLPIRYELLTPHRIKEFRGDIDFLHRMKIAEIETAFQIAPDSNLLYADSDTFFTADPMPLAAQLSANKAFMHLHEYRFGEMDKPMEGEYGKTMSGFIYLIKTHQFTDASGAPFPVSLHDASWNAGVMFFHPSHSRFIPDVYHLTNQFFPASQNHAAEQYAFSLVLQKNVELSPCDSVIYHYWYRTKKQITDLFLADQFDEAWLKKERAQQLTTVKEWTAMMPAYYDNHLMTLQDNAIQAFNENRFNEGYRWVWRALIKAPTKNNKLVKDMLYFIKRKYK